VRLLGGGQRRFIHVCVALAVASCSSPPAIPTPTPAPVTLADATTRRPSFVVPPVTSPSGASFTFQLTADDGNGTVAGPVAVPVSNVVVRAPANSKPSKRVRFRVFGFLPDKRVYLHVRRNGKTKGRFSLGRTSAPCGTTSKKLRFMPLRHYTFGTYRYYFSHSKRFSKKLAIYSARVRIYRTFSSAAHATAAGAWG